MGGEIGTRVAQLLEERREVTEIVGVDFVPPRRRLRRSEFRRIDPRDRDKLAAFAAEFAPDAVGHFGIYEPGSRLPPKMAARYTEAAAVAALGGAARAGKLTRIVLRSPASRSTAAAGAVPACPTRTRRSRPPRRSVGASSPSRRSRSTSVGGTTCRSPRCGWPRSPDRTCRARSGGCCACPRCRSPRSPIPVFQLLHARRRGALDGAGAAHVDRRSAQRRGRRRRERVAGGAARRPRAGADRRSDVVARGRRRSSSRARRRHRT